MPPYPRQSTGAKLSLVATHPPRTKISARTSEWHNVDAALFRNEIVPRDRPAILRGLVEDWPAVRAGRESPNAFRAYIKPFDLGRMVATAIAPPAAKGRLFYRDDMSGFNFEWQSESFETALDRIIAAIEISNPPGVYAGAISTAECFPGFARENNVGFLDAAIPSRIWASNRVVAPAHYDMSDNIACVVSGHRRFVFFPPEQLPNLYVGPLDFTPAGQPTSMVNVAAPDLERYPRFAQALDAAETAELEAGDAVFIPNLWWHDVTSLDPFNILVNYWYYDSGRSPASPFAALVHGILALSDLPESRREMWRKIFDHYVFQTNGDPVPHLPEQHRGMLGRMTPQLAGHIKGWLLKTLQRP